MRLPKAILPRLSVEARTKAERVGWGGIPAPVLGTLMPHSRRKEGGGKLRALWSKVVPATKRPSCESGQCNIGGYLAHPQVGKGLKDDETRDGCRRARLSLCVAGSSI